MITYLSPNFGTQAISSVSCAIVVTDATQSDNPIAYVNSAFSALTGYSSEEAVGRNCRFLQGSATDPRVLAEISAAINAGNSIRREILNYRKDGAPFWNDLTIDPIRDSDGHLTGFVAIQYLTDEVHRAIEARAEVEERLASIADNVPGYIYQRLMRADGSIEIVYCSASISKLLGIDPRDAARNFYIYVHPDDRDALTTAIRHSAVDMTIFREEFRLISASGSTHWMRSDAPPRRLDNGDIVWDGLAIEISSEKRWETEIANQALRDPLTGLLTRAAWRQALSLQLEAMTGDRDPCAALCIDISALSDFNDRLGQQTGDEILFKTGRRIAKIAESVAGVAARLGGDQFAILVPACSSEDALAVLASDVSDALAEPLVIGARSLTIQTAIGATLHRNDGQNIRGDDKLVGELIMQAELATLWAKQGGVNRFRLYSREQDDRFQNLLLLAQSLEEAITKNELELHFQPIVNLASGHIVSAEALVRWNHPTLGMQRPDVFIPLAETSGLIRELGRWTICQAMHQRRQWENDGLAPPPIAINVSGYQLLDRGFAPMVEKTMRELGVRGQDFEFELTEGVLIEPSPQVVEALSALRTLGFKITIDDFGSGHATFRYLRDFPVDKLKIDQMFVRKLVLGSTDALIIQAVISLARGMKIGLVAEGIETDTQRRFLEREGCEVGQGYLFSVPLVAEDFGWLLTTNVRLPLTTAGRQAVG